MDLTEWNDALFCQIVEPGTAGVPLYFYVDRDVLAAAAGTSDAGGATGDFCAAFSAKAAGGRPFQLQVATADTWRAAGALTVPPFLPALAMTVLAVTEEPLGATHGVYRRQNQLLGLASKAAAPPGYGADVPHLWSIWNWWLDGGGRRYGSRPRSWCMR